jgi:hypothetical protein
VLGHREAGPHYAPRSSRSVIDRARPTLTSRGHGRPPGPLPWFSTLLGLGRPRFLVRSPASQKFDLADLADQIEIEVARTRRAVGYTFVGFGLAVGVGSAAGLLWELDARSGGQLQEFGVVVFALIGVFVAALGKLTLSSFRVPPRSVDIDDTGATFRYTSGTAEPVVWAGLRGQLAILDWRGWQDSPASHVRLIPYVLVLPAQRGRAPLTTEAAGALVDSAQRAGLAVEGWGLPVLRNGLGRILIRAPRQ